MHPTTKTAVVRQDDECPACSRCECAHPSRCSLRQLLLAEKGADSRQPGSGIVGVSHVRGVRDLGERAGRKRSVQPPGKRDGERHLAAALQDQDRAAPVPEDSLSVLGHTRA